MNYCKYCGLPPGQCDQAKGTPHDVRKTGMEFCQDWEKPYGAMFMIKDTLWLQYCRDDELLCMTCFIYRLGRRLRKSDLKAAPCNDDWKEAIKCGLTVPLLPQYAPQVSGQATSRREVRNRALEVDTRSATGCLTAEELRRTVNEAVKNGTLMPNSKVEFHVILADGAFDPFYAQEMRCQVEDNKLIICTWE